MELEHPIDHQNLHTDISFRRVREEPCDGKVTKLPAAFDGRHGTLRDILSLLQQCLHYGFRLMKIHGIL